MLKKVKAIINTEAQKCPDFKIIPVYVYPKEIEPIVKECGNKEEMIAEMLANGLLSEADAERYLADESVSAMEMNDVRQMILLCRESRKENKYVPADEVHKMIWEKYFNDQSDDTIRDDAEYTKQLIRLCEKSQRQIDSGQEYSIDEVFNRIKQKYSDNNQSDETATDSVSNSEISTDDAEYRKQILMLIQQSMKDVEEGNTISFEDYSEELRKRYKDKISQENQ